jgi:hypothetical protein
LCLFSLLDLSKLVENGTLGENISRKNEEFKKKKVSRKNRKKLKQNFTNKKVRKTVFFSKSLCTNFL